MLINDYHGKLCHFATAVQHSMRLNEIIQTVVEKVQSVFEASAVELYLIDSGTNMLMMRGHAGLSSKYIQHGMLSPGEGLAGKIVKKKSSLFITTFDSEAGVDMALVHAEQLAGYAGVPLIQGHQILGVLGIYTRVPKPFTPEEQQLLAEVGDVTSQAIQNGIQFEIASARSHRFLAISRVITVTQQLKRLDIILNDISKVLVQTLEFDGAWIGLINPDTGSLEGKAGFGVGLKSEAGHFSFSLNVQKDHPFIKACLQHKPLIYQFSEDIGDAPLKAWMSQKAVQGLSLIPILFEDEVQGLLAVMDCSEHAFDEEDIKALVSISGQTAIAIQNTRLYERMKASEARYRTLFESSMPSLVIIDEQFRFHLVNPAFESLSGFKARTLIQKHRFAEFLKDKTYCDSIQSLLKQNIETEFIDRTGQSKQVHITCTKISDTSNLLISIVDRTQQRDLERRLYRSEELAAIGELSAGIAHEIRNPLVSIKTSVGLLMEEPDLSEEGQQLLDVVREEADHLAAIVEDFLQFARPKEPAFTNENINKIVNDVLKRYRDVNSMHITWLEKLDDSLPVVQIDRHQIQQVLTNLVLNAMQAMDAGGTLEIETRIITHPDNNRCMCITVSDSGNGIPDNNLNRIFQPFFSTKEKGTGMGLAICRRIVDGHGGELLVENRKQGGARFSVILPFRKNNDS